MYEQKEQNKRGWLLGRVGVARNKHARARTHVIVRMSGVPASVPPAVAFPLMAAGHTEVTSTLLTGLSGTACAEEVSWNVSEVTKAEKYL